MSTIIVVHAIQALLLCLMLFTRRLRSLPNLFLAAILFGIVVFYVLHYLALNDLISDRGRLLFWFCFLLPPPLILSYWYTYIHGKVPPKKLVILHLALPFFLFVLSCIIVIYRYSTNAALIAMGEITVAYHIIYPILMLWVLQDFYKMNKKQIGDALKYNTEKTSILMIFGFAMLFHSLLFLIQTNLPLVSPSFFPPKTGVYLQVFFLIVLQYLITWVIINMPVVIHFSDNRIGLAAFKKVKHSSLCYEEATQIAKMLNAHMESAKPYLNPLYSVMDFSRDVNMNYLLVTETLNGLIGQSFNDYINNYRVEEVKRLFKDPAHAKTSILAIAFESGFNSKAAFYASFKRFTNITPSECRIQLRSE